MSTPFPRSGTVLEAMLEQQMGQDPDFVAARQERQQAWDTLLQAKPVTL